MGEVFAVVLAGGVSGGGLAGWMVDGLGGCGLTVEVGGGGLRVEWRSSG